MPIVVAQGCFVPKLHEQLAGLGLPAEKLDFIQRDADSVTRLLVRGILTEGEALRARQRVVKSIERLAKQGSK